MRPLRTSPRLIQLSSRYSDVAPVVPACCNVCRTCTTTNVVGLIMGGSIAAAAAVHRLVTREPRAAS
jgi:hypothetical protein